MLKMLKTQNPDKEYPSNIGQKWTDKEDFILLEELNQNIDIETIAENHNRTIGGIKSRCKEIAYKMFLKNISIEEIIKQTKLDDECIKLIIDKKQNYTPKKIKTPEIKIKTPEIKIKTIETEISEMKNEITHLKNTIKELVEMMKAVYEFEDA